MDNEQKNKFEIELESLEQTVEYKRQQPEPEEEDNIELEGSNVVSARKWRAPKDWRPADWNEERSMQVARQFMGFKASPK